MNLPEFSHSIEIEEKSRQVKIYRTFPDGRKQFYTQIELPAGSVVTDRPAYETLFRMLGENLLLDSPTARRMMQI